MQIQISWLLQKPNDLDLHCLLRQGMSCSAREGLKLLDLFANSVDSDQMSHSVASDLGLHCLLRPICLCIEGYSGTLLFIIYLSIFYV